MPLIYKLLQRFGLIHGFFPWGGSGSGKPDIGDNIANSIMLDSSASQSLSRTFGTPTNNKIFTIRRRIKRGQLGTRQVIIGTCDAGATAWWVLEFLANNTLHLTDTNCAGLDCFYTTAVFDDPTAWLDIVVGYDTTQATAANRVSLEVNGVTISSFSLFVAPPQNSVPRFNSAVPHYIGKHGDYAGYTFYADYYDASNFIIDGQKLPASNWGRFSADSGQWVNKTYTGTYGNNGSKLEYATGASLGTDTSGNGNHWTLNGGITSANQYLDTPTNNFCVFNPLNKSALLTTSKGNTRVVGSGNAQGVILGSMELVKGIWYVEHTMIADDGSGSVGLAASTQNLANYIGSSGSVGYSVTAYSGSLMNNGSALQTLSTYTTGDKISLLFITTGSTGTLTFYKNGVQQGTPVTGIPLTYQWFWAVSRYTTGETVETNAGQRPWAYPAIPAAALATSTSTANLPEGTAAAPSAFTGNATNPGPFIWMNGCPETATVNGNAVVWGTHALRCAGGMQIITSSASYNASGSNTLSCTFLTPNRKSVFKYQTAKGN